MELNWSTFILEIINFLVLVWILKRFFYRPLQDAIARRRAGIEKKLADAEMLHEDAEALQAQYRDRLADWEQERQQAREQFTRELAEERAQRLAGLQAELAQEREKARVGEARRQADILHRAEETALIQAAGFASQLLEQAAGPELEANLLALVIDNLSRLPAERAAALCNSVGQTCDGIVVASAFPLADNQRQKLEKALTATLRLELPFRYEQDTALQAGVRITIGAWVLAANLQDELKSFTEFAHDGRDA